MTQSINISFFGAPNSGKSTLFNKLMEQHVAIVSDKPQTTNHITHSFLQINNITINLFDTPGISFIKNKGLRGVLNEISWDKLKQNYHNFFLVPANKPTIPEEYINKVNNLIVIITKIDMIAQNKIPEIIEKINDLYQPKDILCISAKYDKGIDYLLNYCLSLEERSKILPEDMLQFNKKQFLTDNYTKETFIVTHNEQLAIDMTREGIFNHLRKEIPYYIDIENLQWKEGPKGLHIEQKLWVPNVHYRIILYSQNNLERIKKSTMESLSQLFKKQVFLKFTVKIKKK